MRCRISCRVVRLSDDHRSGVLETDEGAALPFEMAGQQDGACELTVGDRAWVTEEDAHHRPRELTVPHHRVRLHVHLVRKEP